VCIARIAILDTAINLSTSRRHHNSCVLSNAKKIGGVVDLGASAICESVFFWYPRACLQLHSTDGGVFYVQPTKIRQSRTSLQLI
jgi:hypothetical protein